MDFSQLYGTKLDIELASADRTQLFTTERRKEAINDAMLAFVRQTGCTKKYGEIDITDSTEEYNVYDSFTDWIRHMGNPSIRVTSGSNIRYYQGRDFPRRSKEELDRLEPSWRSASDATPAAWYLEPNGGELLLGVYPPPDITAGDTWDWIVPYLAKPTTMSLDAAVPFTVGGEVILSLEPYHQGLVHYAAAQLEPLRKNYSGSERQMKLYTSYVAQYLQQQRQDGPDQITMVRSYYGDTQSRAMDPRRYP